MRTLDTHQRWAAASKGPVVRRPYCVAGGLVSGGDEVFGLQHRDRLALLGDVAASAAHEINGQLLAAFHLLSQVRVALVALQSQLPPPQVSGEALHAVLSQLDEAEDVLERIHRMAQGITAYARSPSPEVRRFDLDEVVASALRIGSVFLSGVASIRARLASTAVVEGRPDAVVQIVVNLLMNAAQSIRDGGGSCVRIDTMRDGAWARLRVKDDGPGVPETIRTRIFEPYFTTKSEPSGTGLGLAVCRELATQQGGSIELVDDGERGAAFEVRLPACSG